MALKTSAEEKEKSQKMLELARKNIYPHHLGSAGYRPKAKKWRKEEEELKKAGKPIPMEYHNERARNWVHARTPSFNSKGDVVFKDPKLQQVANKMKEIVTQQKDGIFVPDREVDQLSVALGTSEHGGRVRGVSSKASWKDGFKEDAASYKKRDRYKEELVASCRAATLQECIRFFNRNPELQQRVDRMQDAFPMPDVPSYPVDDIKEDTPCRLLIPVRRTGKTIQVATGRAMPGRRFHCQDIPDDYAKVEVRTVNEDHRMYEIDFPTPEDIVYLGDAVDQIILWHKKDIQLGSTDSPPRILRSLCHALRNMDEEPRDPPEDASPRHQPEKQVDQPEKQADEPELAKQSNQPEKHAD